MKLSKSLILTCALLITFGLISGCAPSQRNTENGKIVFQSDRDGNYDLYIMNPDGSDQHNLTNGAADPNIANNNFGPVASPDGKRIAFESNRDGNNEIYVIDVDSGVQSNLTKNEAEDYSPTWSPDGKHIAFVSDRDATLLDRDRDIWTNNIYIMEVDGSNVYKLTSDNNSYSYGALSWSPDGEKLALCLSKLSPYGFYYSAGINTMTLSDPTLTRLTFYQSTDQCSPNWSPDGKQILYLVLGSKLSNIYVMNADGAGQAALSKDPSILDTDPSWSPDGKYIVFSSRRGGGYHIYVMNADGVNQMQLTNGPGEETSPVWLPASVP